jgi:hypothetical protein
MIAVEDLAADATEKCVQALAGGIPIDNSGTLVTITQDALRERIAPIILVAMREVARRAANQA